MSARCDICGEEFDKPKSMTNHRRWHKLPKYVEFQKSFIKKVKGVSKNAGKNHPLYGKYHSKQAKQKISIANTGENNGLWKGDNVGYKSLHYWIRNHKPKPELCEKCKLKPPYDLANISGKYKRDINDYNWLCRRCHMESDGRLQKLLYGIRRGKKLR